jgi:hypothetical protein
MGRTDLAIKEYERLVSAEAEDRRGTLVHPFSRLRLAALYEGKGDLQRAAEQYRALGKIWSDADRSLPEVATVLKKLAQLKGGAAGSRKAPVDAF